MNGQSRDGLPQPEDPLEKAAEQGPLPGLEDDGDDGDDQAVAPDSREPVGQAAEDEVEEIAGFRDRG
jgi:hypothetical protein